MNDFALFTCKKEELCPESGKNFFKHLLELLRGRIKVPELDELVDSVELFENTNMHMLKFPYTISEIPLKAANIEKLLALFKNRYSNTTCILTGKISGENSFEGFIKDKFSGRFLYKSLLIQVIDDIYTKRNIEVGALDITIIHGKDYAEIRAAINQLSPYVKFLTIITEEKEQMEKEISNIYYDSGLAVRVTNEYKSGMKNADLIINFADSKEFVFNTGINSRALIINYGEINYSKIWGDNIIINGIDVGIPVGLYSKIDKGIFDYYTRTEIAEIILSHKISQAGKIIDGIYDCELATGFYKEFKKMGFTISGFAGRRNILKAGDIKLYGA